MFALALIAAVTLGVLFRSPDTAGKQPAVDSGALAKVARRNDAAARNAAVRMESESEASAEAIDRARSREEASLSAEPAPAAE